MHTRGAHVHKSRTRVHAKVWCGAVTDEERLVSGASDRSIVVMNFGASK